MKAFRTPSPKKSIKARTTGKINRSVKKAVNPLYGKKGMGVAKDPKKAAYNAVYHRTTVGVGDFTDRRKDSKTVLPEEPQNQIKERAFAYYFRIIATVLQIVALALCYNGQKIGLLISIIGLVLMFIGIIFSLVKHPAMFAIPNIIILILSVVFNVITNHFFTFILLDFLLLINTVLVISAIKVKK